MTPRFLTEAFGVAETDVREGTLQDVIDVEKLDMIKVTDSFRMEDALSGYYAAIKEPLIAPHRPTELISVESTQEEYNAFWTLFLTGWKGAKWRSRTVIRNFSDIFA